MRCSSDRFRALGDLERGWERCEEGRKGWSDYLTTKTLSPLVVEKEHGYMTEIFQLGITALSTLLLRDNNSTMNNRHGHMNQ